MKRLVAVLATCTAIAAGVALPASPAAASPPDCPTNRFCAYQDANYVHQLMTSAAGKGTNVDVADDVVTSGSNRSSNSWKGMDIRWFGDAVAFTWAPTTDITNVGGSANDIINYFIVA